MIDKELVIVGGGLAGLTAAMTAARFGAKTLVIDKGAPGGQIVTIERIENFPCLPEGIAGFDLGPIVLDQAAAAGAEFQFDIVRDIHPDGSRYIVDCDSGAVSAQAVIIAAGSTLRRLGIEGEDALTGRGVSQCASCDGPFFKGRPVGVVGGGDAALTEALVLADYASEVKVFCRSSEPRAQEAIQAQVALKDNISVEPETTVKAVLGEDAVTGVELLDQQSGTIRTEALSGLFVFVGLEPNTAFLRDLVILDQAGHIETDIMMATSRPGIFAAGDLRRGSVRQLAAVAGDGATAAVSAWRYLRGPG